MSQQRDVKFEKAAAVSERLREALRCHQTGQSQDADRLYDEVLARDPSNAEALHYWGVLAGQTGRVDLGIERVRAALALASHRAAAHHDLGELLWRRGETDTAAQSCETAIGLNPSLPLCHNTLGAIRLAQHRDDEAAAHFEAAVRLKPDLAAAWRGLGEARERLDMPQKSVVAYREAVHHAPARLDYHLSLAHAYLDVDEIETAVATFRTVLDRWPDNVQALLGLASAQAQMRDPTAIDTARCATVLAPTNAAAFAALGAHLRDWGRFDEAHDALQAAVRLQGRPSTAYYQLVSWRKMKPDDLGLITEMQDLLVRAEIATEERCALNFALGKAFDDLGRYDEAIAYFDEGNRLARRDRPFRRASMAEQTDGLIGTFDAAYFARLKRWADPSTKPILVVGTPRSGTTLVEQIITRHREVAAGDELRYWGVKSRALGVGFGGKIGPDEAQALINDYLHELTAIGPAALHVTDKMPYNYQLLPLIHALFPNARIIHCRRHPLDTCLSMYFILFGRRHEFTYDRGDLVFFYRQYRRLMDLWRRMIPPDRLIDIDYERLVANPQGETRSLISWCGLDWDERCLASHEGERSIHTASAWQARQPIYRSSAERWRHYQAHLGELCELLDGTASTKMAVQG